MYHFSHLPVILSTSFPRFLSPQKKKKKVKKTPEVILETNSENGGGEVWIQIS